MALQENSGSFSKKSGGLSSSFPGAGPSPKPATFAAGPDRAISRGEVWSPGSHGFRPDIRVRKSSRNSMAVSPGIRDASSRSVPAPSSRSIVPTGIIRKSLT